MLVVILSNSAKLDNTLANKSAEAKKKKKNNNNKIKKNNIATIELYKVVRDR